MKPHRKKSMFKHTCYPHGFGNKVFPYLMNLSVFLDLFLGAAQQIVPLFAFLLLMVITFF
jgi:hypothetical protein